MVREIVIWPDPVLKEIAKPVDAVDDTIRRLLDDMAETMYAADGVGLAAPQIGVSKRLIVIDVSPREPEQKLVHLVNPEIVKVEGKMTYTEGCLSVPGEAEDVERAAKVWVRALGRDGSRTLGRSSAQPRSRRPSPRPASGRWRSSRRALS